MNIGMLWFDNDPKTDLNAKIERAASYYANKYGKLPNVCFVHPSTLTKYSGEKPAPTRVEVRTSASVMPNHYWIGVNGRYD
jgi:hypothetical protein